MTGRGSLSPWSHQRRKLGWWRRRKSERRGMMAQLTDGEVERLAAEYLSPRRLNYGFFSMTASKVWSFENYVPSHRTVVWPEWPSWWRRLSGEQRAAVIFVAIEAALIVFAVGANFGWWEVLR